MDFTYYLLQDIKQLFCKLLLLYDIKKPTLKADF